MSGIPPGERQRGRFRRWLDDWDVFLMIMLTGLLTGLITFMASDAHPGGCHRALAGRPALAWVCERP